MRRALALIFIVCFVSQINAAQHERVNLTPGVASFKADAATLQVGPERPGSHPASIKNFFTASNSWSKIESAPEGDIYSLIPGVQDADSAYPLSDTQAPTSHKFDQTWKSIGGNEFGSPGGTLSCH